MQIDIVTIESFISQKTQTNQVKKLLEGINVAPEVAVATLARHFVDMGIYAVHPGQARAIFDAMLTQIRVSPDLRNTSPRVAKKSIKSGE